MRAPVAFYLVLVVLVTAACTLLPGELPVPSPTPDLPRIEFRFPVNDSAVYEGTDLQLELAAYDPGQGVARIELYIDDQPLNGESPLEAETVPVFTVTMNWLAQSPGRHVLTAIAHRANGQQSDPAVLLVNVLPRETATP